MAPTEPNINEQKKTGNVAPVAPKNAQKLHEYLLFLGEILPKINLEDVHTLYHPRVYEALDERSQELVIQKMHIIMADLKHLSDLWTSGKENTAQAEYYVQSILQYKERLEEQVGDVLIL